MAAAPIGQPVALARALTGFGLGLGEAHDVLNRIVDGKQVPVTLHLTPGGEPPRALGRFGIAVWYPIDQPTESITLRDVSPGVRSAIESWRLARPEQPPVGEAINLMVQEYLTQNGWIAAEEEPQVVGRYRTE